MGDERPLWVPDPAAAARTGMSRFTRQLEAAHGIALPGYDSLHRWSLEHPGQFWSAVWSFCGLRGEPGGVPLRDAGSMPGARWFPEARLNYAENLLAPGDDAAPALLFEGELPALSRQLTRGELRAEVAAFAHRLRQAGIGPGDRVAAVLPNVPEAIVAMLGSAAVGAVWSSCSPDFGVEGVLDRFSQIAPRLLIGVDAYRYGGSVHPVLPKLREIAARLPGLEHTVLLPWLDRDASADGLPGGQRWDDWLAPGMGAPLSCERLPFDHPLFILFSSGTTGAPKCIVHGAGGTLLQHLKEHQLHSDIRPGDRLLYFTTTGWMMWNWQASALASGAALLLYDGSPAHRGQRALWDFAARAGCSHFGASARYFDACDKAGLQPGQLFGLGALRVLLSTGSPLVPERFDYLYRAVKADICLSSISGGTDIISCFALGNPALPVWRGELQCLGLGMAVEVFDDAGQPLRGAPGELVCTRPFPSMPLGFWGDPDGSRYRAAYFERFPGVWHHGDFAELTAHGGLRIQGRSDAVLNPGGVRIGTAEIYRQVEQLDEVLECIAVGQDWQGDVRVVLFVVLRPGLSLDDALRERIRQQLRRNTSPRHVPARILQVQALPRTRSGKLVELAVREVVHGRPVKNLEALANPEALPEFAGREELQR